ncbi:MAG: Asp-tRNA(Asn)/Glu-tRNA(Gln) amidotransferase subunit GatB [Bacilli bacterium]
MLKSVIGLEVHCELNTKSKMFSSSRNSFNRHPNENVCPVDVGFPGTLPTVNKEAVRKAIKIAYALNCEIANKIIFDRKNYYYPDLPKGYQVTQMYKPFGVNGYLDINVSGVKKKILIHDVHLEEDSASLDHMETYSLLDYNRCGTPLIEIVTEPSFDNEEDALAFLEDLRNIFLYLDVSQAQASKGQIRCDVNVSVMQEDSLVLGTRTEMKNINSFSTVKSCIIAEVKRQKEIVENGGVIQQETRRYSLDDNKTYSMRKKEDAIDYKYFVDPNIPCIMLEDKFLNDIKKEIPALPNDKRNIYIDKYGLTLKEANTFIKSKDLMLYFDKCLSLGINAHSASNWITSNILGYLSNENISINDFYITPILLKELILLIENNTISNNQAKDVFIKCINNKISPNEVVSSLGIQQVSDEEEIRKVIKEVLINNEIQVKEYLAGKTNIMGYLVGVVLKQSKGKFNPGLTAKILNEEIGRI